MTITLTLHDGRTASCARPYADAAYVVAGALRCECEPREPLQVAGGRTTTTLGGKRVTAPAGCVRCSGSVGTLTVELDSLFGPDEDRRVLAGQCRVY